MTKLTTGAIIVLVIVASLAVVALGAAITRNWNPVDAESRFSPPREQEQYMRSIRMMNYKRLRRESGTPRERERDVESPCRYISFFWWFRGCMCWHFYFCLPRYDGGRVVVALLISLFSTILTPMRRYDTMWFQLNSQGQRKEWAGIILVFLFGVFRVRF